MLFQTPEFGLLFLVTLVAFYLLPGRFRLWVLAGASILFYAASGLIDLALLGGVLGCSYLLSRRTRPSGPKWPLILGVFLLLGNLAYFKYADFIYESINALTRNSGAPELLRLGGNILPLGISFYTFQIMAYLVLSGGGNGP